MHNRYMAPLLAAVLAFTSHGLIAAEPAKSAATEPVAAQVAEVAKVNLNSADAATLQRELDGIGEVKARAIVEYREANGPFAAVEELLEVKGIGEATLAKNRDRLSVD